MRQLAFAAIFVAMAGSSAMAQQLGPTYAASATNAALNAEISRAEAAEALKAPLASPAFTGTPTLNGSAFGGGGSTTISPVTYTSAGAISTSDAYSLINSSSAVAMTLAAGTNGVTHTIDNYGAGTATVTLSLQGATQSVSLLSGSVLNVFWDSTLSTYLYAS